MARAWDKKKRLSPQTGIKLMTSRLQVLRSEHYRPKHQIQHLTVTFCFTVAQQTTMTTGLI